MTVNMGKIDRALRLVLAAVLIYVALVSDMLGAGPLFWIALAVAAVLAVTAMMGNCPLYTILGLRTCR